jgi:DNA-binding LacI/PurR family transcriptional regulator
VVTIQDVARRAAVSVSTVSNVLNGRADRMRPETLARVEAAIKALQFRPNRLARQLKTGRTPLLGLLVPSMANPMYGTLAREIEACAQERHGYRVLIGSTERDRQREALLLDDLAAHGVRHVIVISSLADERHIEQAAARGMVVVSYDRRATPGKATEIHHVSPDNFGAARLATRHLIDHGHRRLAFATMSGLTMSRKDKIDGFLAAAEEAGLRNGARVLEAGPLDEYGDAVVGEAGRALALRIAKSARRPTGIVAVNDLLALGLMAGLREAGLGVPDDVSIVGIDGLALATLCEPALTTVQLPITEMAQAMVERAMTEADDGSTIGAERVFEEMVLLERGTVSAMHTARNGSARAARAPTAARKSAA